MHKTQGKNKHRTLKTRTQATPTFLVLENSTLELVLLSHCNHYIISGKCHRTHQGKGNTVEHTRNTCMYNPKTQNIQNKWIQKAQ